MSANPSDGLSPLARTILTKLSAARTTGEQAVRVPAQRMLEVLRRAPYSWRLTETDIHEAIRELRKAGHGIGDDRDGYWIVREVHEWAALVAQKRDELRSHARDLRQLIDLMHAAYAREDGKTERAAQAFSRLSAHPTTKALLAMLGEVEIIATSLDE